MRSQSPLLSPFNQDRGLKFQTPNRSPNLGSTGVKPFQTPQCHQNSLKLQLQQINLSPTRDQLIRGSQTINYFPNNIGNHTKNQSNILFKSGYEFQEEVKKLHNENKQLQDLIKKQREQLQQFLSYENVFLENEKLRKEIERLTQENEELRNTQIQYLKTDKDTEKD